jgi:hypothetical protein
MIYKISLSVTVHELGRDGYSEPDEVQYVDLVARDEELPTISQAAGPVVNSMIQICTFKLKAAIDEANNLPE